MNPNNDTKNKGIITKSSHGSNAITCFNCGGKRYFSISCPSRNMLLEQGTKEDEDDFEEHMLPKDSSSEDEKTISGNAQPTLAVVRCMLSLPRDDD